MEGMGERMVWYGLVWFEWSRWHAGEVVKLYVGASGYALGVFCLFVCFMLVLAEAVDNSFCAIFHGGVGVGSE